jgi:ssDNA-binding Zn-finger/Zn-ribbon topoisomerase 1
MTLAGYDAWKTSGRYSRGESYVTCPNCDTETLVFTETEYGYTSWTPEECPACLREFDGGEPSREVDEYDDPRLP